ncbi:hypothetical protein CEXT_742621 [Caerostris extrusa]|uniref:Uncharacterized protein n=1 Tax=Caerostris extrusa TaxID=172846 RepID=A0AAV4U8I0_CAEEX|nr:hypothetical protein CEXT_742621 [Caerostris extrusa]
MLLRQMALFQWRYPSLPFETASRPASQSTLSGEPFTAKNVRANQMGFRNLSKLSFPYRGYNSLESVRAVVKRIFDEKDRGRELYVAVKGDEIKDFFVSCGLPVCEMKRDVLGDSAPKYTDFGGTVTTSPSFVQQTTSWR